MQRKIGRIEPGLMQRIMAEAREAGVKEIGFYTTGDPFVHKNLEGFTEQARKLGFEYIYISTNGALATPNRMKAVVDAGMNSVKFSINAGSRETFKTIHGRDDWEKVVKNLEYLSAYRETLDRPLALSISSVVTDLTRHEKDQFKRQFGPLVDDIVFYEVFNQSGQMTAALSLISNQPAITSDQSSICPMPFNRLHVTCEGYLTLCCTDYQNYLAVADLREMSLSEGWYSPAFVDIRLRHMEQRLEGTLCGNCWLNRMDEIASLDEKLGSEIDFDALREETVQGAKERFAGLTEDVGD